MVQLVDFGDFVRIDEKDVCPIKSFLLLKFKILYVLLWVQMFQIPDELIEFPEASTPCAIAELMGHPHPPTEEMKNEIKKMIPEQNLYCVIGHSKFIDDTVVQGAKEK
jgi:hypothetical protein